MNIINKLIKKYLLNIKQFLNNIKHIINFIFFNRKYLDAILSLF